MYCKTDENRSDLERNAAFWSSKILVDRSSLPICEILPNIMNMRLYRLCVLVRDHVIESRQLGASRLVLCSLTAAS